MSNAKFKVGDKIRSVKSWSFVEKDEIYTYNGDTGEGYIQLKEFMESNPRHSIAVDRFELVETKQPRKHAELIHAWADGKQVQYLSLGGKWRDITNPLWNDTGEYRIKPEPKPDVYCYEHISNDKLDGAYFNMSEQIQANCKFTFDGETGKLKSVELIE